MRHRRNSIRRRRFMAATVLACTTASSRAFLRSPPAKRLRNLPQLSMQMALNSRELRFYGGGMALNSRERQFCGGGSAVGTLESPEAYSCEELLPDRIRVAATTASHTAAAFSLNNGFGPSIFISDDERHLFELLAHVREECDISSTLRVAGGWVRDKLLSTPEFQRRDQKGERLTSKFHKPSPQGSMGRQGGKILQEEDHQPVDIDIALDDMLGREFADHLNDYLQEHGQKTVSVGVVLKNPEKSKHLETATMKVGSFWVDFVNLRAEEYTKDSRIPDLMRIGSPSEDAFRRDLTINALFYNINTGQVEDWTGRGFDDLKRGIVATPLAPLTTLLDDPLRVLRSVRFAARLRFAMDDALVEAAMNERVRDALDEKVSRERVGCEVDLMLRSPDPVGAMRLLINLNLIKTVFPLQRCLPDYVDDSHAIFTKGLDLLSTAHDHLSECKMNPPLWCEKKRCMSSATYGVDELPLAEDEEARRLLYYAAFLKPFMDSSHQLDLGTKRSRGHGRKAHRSVICSLLVDELKRPVRDVEAVVRIMKAADDVTNLINSGCDLSATSVLLGGIRVIYQNGDSGEESFSCYMNSKKINSEEEEDPLWEHAMEFRLLASKMLQRTGSLWRASLILSLSEQLASLQNDGDYYIEGDVMGESQEERRQGIIELYYAFAAALQQLGLIGIWSQKPMVNGGEVIKILPNLPKGPEFREVMEEQDSWMTTHPGASKEVLAEHLRAQFPEYN